MLDSQAQATIDQSTKVPDFFSCCNCAGYDRTQTKQPGHPLASQYGWVDVCIILREEGRCRLDMLREALRSGAVQVHIAVAPAPLILEPRDPGLPVPRRALLPA